MEKILVCILAACFTTIVAAQDASEAPTRREDIHPVAEAAQPLMPGMTAPGFTVYDGNGEAVTFDPQSLQAPLIITFYRGGWCPYCNLHLSEMRHAEEKIEEMGFDIWFISVDRPELLKASLDEPDLNYLVLSDSDLNATRAFGIAFRLSDETFERYLGYNIDIEEVSGRDHHVLPVPSTFIIGTDGVIQFAYSNPNYKIRLSPSLLLTAAEMALSNTDDRLIKAREAQRNSEADK